MDLARLLAARAAAARATTAAAPPRSAQAAAAASHTTASAVRPHGTGCALSSALATLRPQVADWEEATGWAKRWLTEAIRHGAELEVGGGHGPVSHFAALWPHLSASPPLPRN